MKKNNSGKSLQRGNDLYAFANKITVQSYQEVIQKYGDLRKACRSEHYVFILLQGGKSSFMIDFEKITLTGRSLFYYSPNCIHYHLSSDNATGLVLFIEPHQMERQYAYFFEEKIGNASLLTVSEDVWIYLECCMRLLQDILRDAKEILLTSVVGNLASACIDLITEEYYDEVTDVQKTNKRYTVLARRFTELLKGTSRKMKGPSQYAAELRVSSNYLNECVKSTTGKPVSYWIQHQIVQEGKRLLYYSDLSIKQISFELGFSDLAHFSKLFMKISGVTPKAFRKSFPA